MATRRRLATSPEEVWNRLIFYEEVAESPPLYLRLLLPRPVRVEGRKSEVGDEALCVYAEGELVKRVTRVERPRRYEFVIADQRLAFGWGIRLTGGSYALRALPGGGTELEVTTGYEGARRPRWLWHPIESAVCHLFHRYLLRMI